ncbi:hypothetical protein OAT06_00240 [Nitrospinaceae bacterium]|nr:hypothetical protein [Nitrospinaceae bacterium]
MATDPEPHEEEKVSPAKPSGLEMILIIVFLMFVAWGTYEFGIWVIKDGGKIQQEKERYL